MAPISIVWPLAALPSLSPHFGAFAAEAGAAASIDARPATAQASTITVIRGMEIPPQFLRARCFAYCARETRPTLSPAFACAKRCLQIDTTGFAPSPKAWRKTEQQPSRGI